MISVITKFWLYNSLAHYKKVVDVVVGTYQRRNEIVQQKKMLLKKYFLEKFSLPFKKPSFSGF